MSDLPLDASDEEDEVAVDFGTVHKLVNVAGIYRLGVMEVTSPYAVTH